MGEIGMKLSGAHPMALSQHERSCMNQGQDILCPDMRGNSKRRGL